MKPSSFLLDSLGGMPDRLMLAFPRLDRPAPDLDRQEYLDRLRACEPSLLHLPDKTPEWTVHMHRPVFGHSNCAVSFPSGYRPRLAAHEEAWKHPRASQTGWLHLWQNDPDRRSPLILFLHGYMMGTPVQAERMLGIRKHLGLGLDVALCVAPLHGKRGGTGLGLLDPHNVPLTIERLAQGVHDVHSAVLVLRALGWERIGLIGASLGGLHAALYLSLADDVDFGFTAVPAIGMGNYLLPRRGRSRWAGDDEIRDATRLALKTIHPAERAPVIEPPNIGVALHTGDRLCPVGHSRRWIAGWGIPDENVAEVRGGHWVYFDRRARGKHWYRWLTRFGFLEPQTEGQNDE